jgi:hypothetical protein
MIYLEVNQVPCGFDAATAPFDAPFQLLSSHSLVVLKQAKFVSYAVGATEAPTERL